VVNILISEVFPSIQGEGINVGKPTVFVRVAGCNLRCTKKVMGFDCDTPYAVLEEYKKEWKTMTVDQLVEKIKEYPSKNIVFTGGEPSLQIKEILEVMSKLNEPLVMIDEYTFEVETNGTLYFPTKQFDILTVSPKKNAVNMDVLKFLAEDRAYFKFVIATEDDFEYWLEVVQKCELDNDRVIMMPEGITDKLLKKTALWLVEKCKEYNFRFSPRVHIWLWGMKRGK